MENQIELDINAKEKSVSWKGMKANKFVSARDKGCSDKWPKTNLRSYTIVNSECGETNFQYALVHDICVCAENWQTPTSGGVNVAATRNSILRSCSNAFAVAIPEPPGDTRSCSLKSDLNLGSRNVTENSRMESENQRNRWDTRAWRKSGDANFCGTTVAKFHWFRSRSRFEW